jgi:arylsulfatase A-like enzyme
MNVLVLYVDDWRWDSIGEEDSIIQTPFLDSFAKDNIRFRQNAVTTSICWQSRATLFTGQWASRHRSFKLRCPHFTVGKAWNQTWAGMLRNDGYHLGHIGKWQYHNSDLGKFRFDWWSIFEGRDWNLKANVKIIVTRNMPILWALTHFPFKLRCCL